MKTAKIEVTYDMHMGSDLQVVNAARASFGKRSELTADGLAQKDANLIRFLARGYTTEEWEQLAADLLSAESKEDVQSLVASVKVKAQHWAPFAHPHISIRVKAPIFVARQLVKHQIGGVWSEGSRRYMDSEPEFFFPDAWHGRPKGSIKQGSGAEHPASVAWSIAAGANVGQLVKLYNEMIADGIAPEQARMILPQNMMVEWYWTGSLLFFARLCQQRLDSHAQAETREAARQIEGIVEPLFPVSWKELTSGVIRGDGRR